MRGILQIIWTSLNSLRPMMMCVKFGRYWSTGSGRKYFNFVNVFSLFPCHLPVVKGRVSLNLESLSFKDAVCQVWLIVSQRFWKRRFVFFNFVTALLLFNHYFHLDKLVSLLFKDAFLPYLFEIGSMVIEEKTKIWKAHNNDEKNNNDYKQRANIDRKSSPE